MDGKVEEIQYFVPCEIVSRTAYVDRNELEYDRMCNIDQADDG